MNSEQQTRENEALRVLIADDDPPTRILLKAAIQKWGYIIAEASDGEAAWQILQQENPPEILLLDWIMPKLDGIGLCERIKSSKMAPPYIILLTQVTGTTNIIKGLEAGADEFLSKPFNMAELRSRLSVGARIIRQTKQLHENFNQIETITTLLNDLSKQIKALSEKPNKDSENSLKLQELDAHLERINEIIHRFQSYKN